MENDPALPLLRFFFLMKREGPLHKKAYGLKDQTKDTSSQKTSHARVRDSLV